MPQTMTATPQMAKVGLTFASIEDYARKAVDLLKAHGDDVLGLVDAGFRAFMALSTRDFPTLLAALNDVNKNATTVYTAIVAEFGIVSTP